MRVATQNTPKSKRLNDWGLLALLLSIATALGLALAASISLTNVAMIYVLAVVIGAYRLDQWASITCALGAVAALNFFFVPPRWTLSVDQQEHLITLTAMLVVALVTSRLATGLRRETRTAQVNEARARQLQALATALGAAGSPEEVCTVGRSALAKAFAGPVDVALTDAQGALQNVAGLNAAVHDGMQACIKHGDVLGPGTRHWSGLDAWYLPLGEQGRMYGAVCIQQAVAEDPEALEHARALALLLTQALWRLSLSRSMLTAQGEAQRQQLLATFLAAISHDLRTPLATIVGAASSLQTQGDRLPPAQHQRLLASIAAEANYLSTLTENTLQFVRLSQTLQTLHRDWESVEEIIGAALARVRPCDGQRRIQSEVPPGLPLVRADPVLIGQLLVNLLDNALKYSSAEIRVTAQVRGDSLQLDVLDRGPGIAPAAREAIFQPYARNDHSGQRGAGLGLAVCRAIAKAHGASLTVQPREDGGSCFRLSLPIEAQPETHPTTEELT